MKQFFLDNATKFITTYKDYTKDEVEKLQYGLEGLYLTITKSIIIVLVSSILGILKETLIILVFFNILRFTAFGFHAENSIQCLLLSIILFSILPYLCLSIPISIQATVFISIICFLTFLLFAPADTIKRPLTNKRKRHIRKFVSVLCAGLYIMIIFLVNSNEMSTLLLISLIIESIMIHPITYLTFQQPFNNYKIGSY